MSGERMFDEVGSRVAAYVRQQYPRHASKLLQRQFDLNERTATRVLSGSVSNKTLERMVRAWGPSFAQFCFEPLTGSILSAPACLPRTLWFTENGLQDCPDGHKAYAMKAVGLKDSGQDFCLFFMRNYGFIEASINTDGIARLRYSEAGASEDALKHAAEWLQTITVQKVERRVETPNGWTDHIHPSAIDAAQALSRQVVARHAPLPTWTVERLNLDEIQRPDFGELIQSHANGNDPTPIAAGLKLLDTSSIFSVEGSNVTSLWCGPALKIPRDRYMGRNVLDRPEQDQPYAALVCRRVLEAKEQGATLYRLAVDIDGKRRLYQSLAVNCGSGRVMSVADLSEEAERVAA